MKLLVLLTLIALAKAKVILERHCDGVIIDNYNHEKEVLKSNLDAPYQLAIDHDTNTLFFSYTANTNEVLKSAYLNLKNNEFGVISGIKGGFAHAVDGVSHNVYLGGKKGIYKYDFSTKKAIDLKITRENIWQLFFNKELYFTNYPDEEAYVYKGGKVDRVPELKETKAMLIAVDENKNIFFSNQSGLFSYRSENNNTIKLGDYSLYAFTNDINGNLYFSTSNNFYFINDGRSQVEQVASLEDDVYGMAIENDGNIIYASSDSIIRLKRTGHICFSDKPVVPYVDDVISDQ